MCSWSVGLLSTCCSFVLYHCGPLTSSLHARSTADWGIPFLVVSPAKLSPVGSPPKKDTVITKHDASKFPVFILSSLKKRHTVLHEEIKSHKIVSRNASQSWRSWLSCLSWFQSVLYYLANGYITRNHYFLFENLSVAMRVTEQEVHIVNCLNVYLHTYKND